MKWTLAKLRKFISDHEDRLDEYSNRASKISSFPGCCGMTIIHYLDNESSVLQAALLLNDLEEENVGAVCITDNKANIHKWAATKYYGSRTPWVTNPKHNSKIALWYITRKDILKIANYKGK